MRMGYTPKWPFGKKYDDNLLISGIFGISYSQIINMISDVLISAENKVLLKFTLRRQRKFVPPAPPRLPDDSGSPDVVLDGVEFT